MWHIVTINKMIAEYFRLITIAHFTALVNYKISNVPNFGTQSKMMMVILKVDQCVSYRSGLANVNCKEDVSEVSEDFDD